MITFVVWKIRPYHFVGTSTHTIYLKISEHVICIWNNIVLSALLITNNICRVSDLGMKLLLRVLAVYWKTQCFISMMFKTSELEKGHS